MDNPSFTLDDLDARLKFRSLWTLGIEGEGVTVAMIDSGIHHTPDLEKSIEIDKDFTGENHPEGAPDSHATSMAQSIHLVAPKARFANLKVLSDKKDPDRDTVCRAVQFCIDQYPRYKIINLSLYFLPDGCCAAKRCALCAKVNEAVRKGIVVVAAAGNLGPRPGSITCPGLAEDALTVGSSWSKQEAQWWENTSHLKRWWLQTTGEFGKTFGTSFSAAWVSGCLALLLSSFKDVSPYAVKDAAIHSSFIVQDIPVIQCNEAYNYLLAHRG